MANPLESDGGRGRVEIDEKEGILPRLFRESAERRQRRDRRKNGGGCGGRVGIFALLLISLFFI